MSQDHRLQQQRFELKHLIDERITLNMRDFIRAYLELDEYGLGKPNLAYPFTWAALRNGWCAGRPARSWWSERRNRSSSGWIKPKAKTDFDDNLASTL